MSQGGSISVLCHRLRRSRAGRRSTVQRKHGQPYAPRGDFPDLIGESPTSFGNIPLTAEQGHSLMTLRNSRLDVKGQISVGSFQFDAYVESDVMNFTVGQSPWG
jgi:hypothetical protein